MKNGMKDAKRVASLSWECAECEGPARLNYKFLKRRPYTLECMCELCGEVDRVNGSFVQAENQLLVGMPRFLSGAMDECREAEFIQATHRLYRVGVANYLAALKIAKKHDKSLFSTCTLFREDDARSPVLAAMCRHLLAQPFVISLQCSYLFDICLHRMHKSSPGSSAAGSLNSGADAHNAVLIRIDLARMTDLEIERVLESATGASSYFPKSVGVIATGRRALPDQLEQRTPSPQPPRAADISLPMAIRTPTHAPTADDDPHLGSLPRPRLNNWAPLQSPLSPFSGLARQVVASDALSLGCSEPPRPPMSFYTPLPLRERCISSSRGPSPQPEACGASLPPFTVAGERGERLSGCRLPDACHDYTRRIDPIDSGLADGVVFEMEFGLEKPVEPRLRAARPRP